MAATLPPAGSDGYACAMWRRSLASALRTTLACAVVGVATLLGPETLRRQVSFPAFSYVTVVLLVTDATTVGDALHACWVSACATAQGVCPAILVLWLLGGGLTTGTTAAAVALHAFLVALPGELTHVVAKRVALGQVVIVYVVAFIKGGAAADPVMHPLRLAASTALGAAACVFAVFLPFPILASSEVRENCKMYIESASERVKLYVKAFSAQDMAMAKSFITQTKSLNTTANKFLNTIQSKQESMNWERIFPSNFFKKNQSSGEALQGIETVLRGMENAISNFTKFPAVNLDSEAKKDLTRLEERILSRVKSMAVENSILPDGDDNDREFLQTLHPKNGPLMSQKDLPPFFFIFCLKLLETSHVSAKEVVEKEQGWHRRFLSQMWTNLAMMVNKRRLMPALKCSLSVGFATLFGLMYSKPDGFWSGLPVAISVASAREATFRVTNIKAQGTVLGTVYAVIGCSVFAKYAQARFISLLPWFVFCGFLRQSRMYGPAGGVSAVIGAVLILGRKNFGLPSDFAIARIVETFIGLSCSIVVDISLHPTRAAVLAKFEVAASLSALHECIASMALASSTMEERMKEMRLHVSVVGKLIEEAEAEPNFWFLPFNGACYRRLRLSLSHTADLMQFGMHAIRSLDEELEGKKELAEQVAVGLKAFREAACHAVRRAEEGISVKSIGAVEREYEKRGGCVDVEMGKTPPSFQWPGLEGGGVLRSMDEWLDGVVGSSSMRVRWGAMVHCMEGVVKESGEIWTRVEEILQWENPTVKLDLDSVLCKLHFLNKTQNNV